MVGHRPDPRVAAHWAKVRGALRAEVGDAAYRSWLKPLTLVAVEDLAVRLAVPTRFMRDWVVGHYAERILELWAQHDPQIAAVDIEIRAAPARRQWRKPPAEAPSPAPTAPPSGAGAPERRLAEAAAVPTRQDGNEAALDPRFVFDNFIVGKPNELAHAAARRIAERPTADYNPLFLYGGVGMGKTHLMHAIGWHVRHHHPNRRMVYISAEKFMNQFVRALRSRDTIAFKERFRSVNLLMIDDLQFINGKESTQEEFFHTFDELVGNRRQVVVSADKSPSDLPGMGERLRSRLGAGLVADIGPTTYELRVGILESKARNLEVALPPAVVEFLARRITASAREIEGALNRVVAQATLIGREISLDTCREVLHDLLRSHDRRPTIDVIQQRVSERFAIQLSDMLSERRSRDVTRPRQLAMYLSKKLTPRSLPEIGRKFRRDHTTVMHAVRRIEALRASDDGFDTEVALLMRILEE